MATDGIRYLKPAGTDGVMFRYVPGDSLSTATATRASVATYASANTFNSVVSDLLLRYVPGDSTATATMTRAGVATFAGRA